MFGFPDMADNYEERKVDHFEDDNLIVDTAAITDSDQPYETAVCHRAYNDGGWVVVELYPTKDAARMGHDKWVKRMTAKKLPRTLKDVSRAITAQLIDAVASEDDKGWRTKEAASETKKGGE